MTNQSKQSKQVTPLHGSSVRCAVSPLRGALGRERADAAVAGGIDRSKGIGQRALGDLVKIFCGVSLQGFQKRTHIEVGWFQKGSINIKVQRFQIQV